MRNRDLLWFILGVIVLGMSLGILTGMTATSVVNTLIPLLFALLTAGGAIYVVRGGEKRDNVDPAEQSRRANFLGKQLLAFSFGFLLGLWLGVAAKYHAETVWLATTPPTPTAAPAYNELTFSDLRLVPVAIELDERMMQSGLDYQERVDVFQELNGFVVARTNEYGLDIGDVAAVELLINRLITNAGGVPVDESPSPASILPQPDNGPVGPTGGGGGGSQDDSWSGAAGRPGGPKSPDPLIPGG